MKKVIAMLIGILLLTGCGIKEKTEEEQKQENIIGTWKTTYKLSVIGEVSEKYTFKEKEKCVRVLNAGTDIVDECTYEITEEGIRIIWKNKIDKESYSKYVEIDNDTILIGEHTYQRESE